MRVTCLMTYSYSWDMTHSYVWHDSFICVPWLIHICDMTHSHVRHDSSVCGTWLLHMYDTSYPHDLLFYFNPIWFFHFNFFIFTWFRLIHDALMCHGCAWLKHTWNMTRSCVWHAFISYSCNVLMWHDSFTFVTWLLYLYDMTPTDFSLPIICTIWMPYLTDSWEVGGWGRDPFSRNLMSPTPRRKWYLTTGRRAH